MPNRGRMSRQYMDYMDAMFAIGQQERQGLMGGYYPSTSGRYPTVHGETIYPEPKKGSKSIDAKKYLEMLIAAESERRAKLIDRYNEQYPTDQPMEQPQPEYDEMYVSERVNPPPIPLEQNSWAAFQAMNPNLDYAKVAQQAGGKMGSIPVSNEYGANISEMPESDKQREQVKSLMDYVNNQIPIDEFYRKMDTRSRAYDPKGAELLMELASNNKRDAAYELMQRAEAQLSEAKTKESEAIARLLEEGNAVPRGYKDPNAGANDALRDPRTYEKLAEMAKERLVGVDGYGAELSDDQKKTVTELNTMVTLATEGRFDEAQAIWRKYSPSVQPNQAQQSTAPGGRWSEREDGTPVLKLG